MHLFTGGSISWHHRCVTHLCFYSNEQQSIEVYSAIEVVGIIKSAKRITPEELPLCRNNDHSDLRAGGTTLFYNRKQIKATPLEWIGHKIIFATNRWLLRSRIGNNNLWEILK
jgi:hypothetical protein